MKTIAKMLWRGKVTVLAVVIALTLVAGGTAIAKPKLVKATLEYVSSTGLVGSVMKLTNDQGGSALDLVVNSGKAPLSVNSGAGTATNLSADKLDGNDSSAFLGANQKAADADKLDGKDSTAFWNDGRVYRKFYLDYVASTTNTQSSFAITCEPGDAALSGGYEVDPATPTPTGVRLDRVSYSLFATGDQGYWLVWDSASTSNPAKMKLSVVCADLGTPITSGTSVTPAKASAPASSGEIEGAETAIEGAETTTEKE